MARGRKNETPTAQETETVSDSTETTETPESVTDQTASEASDGTENEASDSAEASGYVFNEGDPASVIRGKLRGQKGEIISYDPAGKQYAIRLESGTLAVVNAKNLKAPQDATVSQRALVEILAQFLGGPDDDAARRIASALDSIAPETSVKLNEGTAGNVATA